MSSAFCFIPPQSPQPSALSPLPFASVGVMQHLPHSYCIPLCGLIKPPQDQGSPLLLMSEKGSSASYVSAAMDPLPVLSLVGGLVPPWELWVVWLANIVVSVVLQSPSAPPVLLPAPSSWSAASA